MQNKLDYNKNWSEYFRLDKNSPSGLVRVKDYYGKSVEDYNVGHAKSYKNGNPQAWYLSFQHKFYAIHRIIWVMTYGSIDLNLVVDHLDGNPFNNQIDNLSLKTQEDNNRNSKKRKDNTTGVTGVSLREMKGGYWYYTARWYTVDGKRKCKHFSFLEHGEDTAKFLAIAYRAEQIQRLILEGADYTERHGVTLERKIS